MCVWEGFKFVTWGIWMGWYSDKKLCSSFGLRFSLLVLDLLYYIDKIKCSVVCLQMFFLSKTLLLGVLSAFYQSMEAGSRQQWWVLSGTARCLRSGSGDWAKKVYCIWSDGGNKGTKLLLCIVFFAYYHMALLYCLRPFLCVGTEGSAKGICIFPPGCYNFKLCAWN